MRKIEIDTWQRRDPYKFFSSMASPHFSLTADVDLTVFRPAVKESGHSFTVAMVYVIGRAANRVPELRCRIRGEQVIEHEIVHPTATILLDDDRFSFCIFDYNPDFAAFADAAEAEITQTKADPLVKAVPGDDLLYMTCLPWTSFTSFVHPVMGPDDSVPRIAWGKYFQDGNRQKMPLNIQVHHGMVDGLHAGRFFNAVQELLDHPETWLEETAALAWLVEIPQQAYKD
jgi:chloramphenicol O-acetyltransferase type A